jgi:myo-inositol-1(or 4)-monophosphatase
LKLDILLKQRDEFDQKRVEIKGKNDLVSYVDKEAEKMIVSKLQQLFPEAGFVTEEATVAQERAHYSWIIDPLDGTTNFIHGLPIFSVSIALMEANEVVLGVVYEVNRDECFYATKGGGAFCNDKPISVSDAPTIDKSLLATGFPYYNFEKLTEYLAILNELMKNTHGLRRMGSAAVDLAYVACGRYEGYFEYNLNPWDVAAGVLIVEEAGGKVTDFSGGRDFVFGRELVAANAIHTELLGVIQKFW